MATATGELIEAIGAKMATTFAGYSVIYGLPAAGGYVTPLEKSVRVHWMQEEAEPSGNQLNGVQIVRPRIAITVERLLATDYAGATTLDARQSLCELASDLRLAVQDLVASVLAGSTTIAGVWNLWITDTRITPATLDNGTEGFENVTIEIGFRYVRAYGGR